MNSPSLPYKEIILSFKQQSNESSIKPQKYFIGWVVLKDIQITRCGKRTSQNLVTENVDNGD